MRRAKRKPVHRMRRKMICAALAAVACLLVLEHQLRPVIASMAADQCRAAAAMAINSAVQEELTAQPHLYENLYKIQYGEDNTIRSIQTDAAAVNQAKAHLTAAVLENLQQLDQQVVRIPLGTLLGWQLLAGWGPELSMRTVPSAFATSEFSTRLESQGINQTLMMGTIEFHVEISAILPGYSATEQVTDEVCVAQTLVIGQLPQVYAALK